MRHRFASRVRLHRDEPPSPTFVPLTIFRGLAGVAFLCFGELFWMHMSRIGMEGEAKMMGTIALILGSMTAVGALCGAAGISVSSQPRRFFNVEQLPSRFGRFSRRIPLKLGNTALAPTNSTKGLKVFYSVSLQMLLRQQPAGSTGSRGS